jgi:hypothetical protein
MAPARQHLLSKSIEALKLTKIHYAATDSYTVLTAYAAKGRIAG